MIDDQFLNSLPAELATRLKDWLNRNGSLSNIRGLTAPPGESRSTYLKKTSSNGKVSQWAVIIEDALFQVAANTLKVQRYVINAPGARVFMPTLIGMGMSNPRPAAVSSSAELRGYVFAGDQVAAVTSALDPVLAKGVLGMVYSSQVNDAAGKPLVISDGSAKQFVSKRVLDPDPDGQFSITVAIIGVGCNAPNVVKFIVEGVLIGESI